MIRSMTGFGRATAEFDKKQLIAEVRSVNSKGLDLSLRLPQRYREKESELRSFIGKEVERGKVDVSLYFENSPDSSKSVSINKALAKAYYEELSSLSEELKVQSPDLLSVILRMPEIFSNEVKEELSEDEQATIVAVLTQACVNFKEFRLSEGLNLFADLKERISNIEKYLSQIEGFEPQRTENIRLKLKRSLDDIIDQKEVDQNRFEQELVYYIEKLDITEEKVRLRSHCTYFMEMMNEEVSNGRKLGFIGQEIGREINTIGSKANDADIQKLVVMMKDELEKVKEQVLNVL